MARMSERFAPWLRGSVLLVMSALLAGAFLWQTPDRLHCWGTYGVLTSDEAPVHARPQDVFSGEFFRVGRVPSRARLITTDPFARNGLLWRDRTDPGHVFVLALDGSPIEVFNVAEVEGGYQLLGSTSC